MGANFVLGLCETGARMTTIGLWASFEVFQNSCQYITPLCLPCKLMKVKSGYQEVVLQEIRQQKYETLPENYI